MAKKKSPTKSAAAKKPTASTKRSTKPSSPAKSAKPSASKAKAAPKTAQRTAVKSKPKTASKSTVAKKPVAKSAPASKKVTKPTVETRSAQNSKTSSAKNEKKSVSTAGKVAIGVAAVGAAIGVAQAAKKENSSKLQMAEEKSGNTSGQLETAITRPATRNAPAMKLSVNDAEILASAKERYGAKDLAAFKKLIIEQRAEASEEFDIISEQMLDTSGEFDADNQSFSLHTAEQGTDAMEREKTFLHAQRTSDFIKKLDEAMERIERGTYGICVICGKLIEKQRLAAVPITQKHVDCKNKTQTRRLNVDQSFRDIGEEPPVVE